MFFDNASTTKIDKDIINNLEMINEEYYYNPGALYSKGRRTKSCIENCRKVIKECIGAEGDSTIVFTGSATEANNLAMFGVLKKNTRKILVSMGEHPSVYNTALEIKNRGYNVEFVNLDKTGRVDIVDFKQKLTSDVDIVSIMHVSNETGAINDIAELVKIAKNINPKVIFHTDGVQAIGKIGVSIEELGVDMYTMSAHKIHGCKGVGALYIKRGLKLKPIIFGGGQEFDLRSGTENVLGIYTLSKAVENATQNLNKNYSNIQSLKDEFINGIDGSGLKYYLHSNNDCSPYIVSISFDKCRSETILNMLNDKGIYVGNGSACSSKKSGNRILENMGVNKLEIEGNLRVSFSKYNTSEEVTVLVKELRNCITDYLQRAR